jgi:hypothetical protein
MTLLDSEKPFSEFGILPAETRNRPERAVAHTHAEPACGRAGLLRPGVARRLPCIHHRCGKRAWQGAAGGLIGKVDVPPSGMNVGAFPCLRACRGRGSLHLSPSVLPLWGPKRFLAPKIPHYYREANKEDSS